MGWNPIGNVTKLVQKPSLGNAVQAADWFNLYGKDGLAQSLGGKKPNISGLDPTNVKKTEVKPAQTSTMQDFLARAQTPVNQVQGTQLGVAPTIAASQIAQDQLNPLRQQNAELVSQLSAQPTFAQAQFAANTEAGLRAAQAQQASQRGVSAALANRNLQNQMAAQNQASAQQGALAALQERNANQQLLAQINQNQFGQEASLAGQQAQLGQNAALANQSLQGQFGLQQGQLTQQANLANQDAYLRQLQIQGNAAAGIDNALNQNSTTQAQLDSQRQAQIAQGKGAILGGLAQGGVLAATKSDERAKKDKVKSKDMATDAVKEFLDATKPFEFRYNEAAPDSEPVLGIMAQDLEKTRIGRQMVRPGPDGVKRVDFGQGFGALVAAIGELNQKVEKRRAA